MTAAPLLLDDNGDASIATAIMMSHHGFRRDLARFRAALGEPDTHDAHRLDALGDEWKLYRNTLHGHHQAEDTGLFPHLRGQHEALRPTLDRLTADHARIDPILARGDRVFADLPREIEAARQVLNDLGALLDPHLATEETEVIPHLRAMKGFPPPGTPEEAEMFAEGFAWASHGIAPQVLQQVYAMLPPIVTSRLPGARSAFEKRWLRVWGPVEVGASLSPIPDR
jgi:hypothetical protein